MPFPVVPVVIGSLAALAAFAQGKRRRGMTPERKAVFETLMNEPATPGDLRKMAKVFDEEGCHPESLALEARARIRELPPELRVARREAFKKALKSTNADAVEGMAKAYEKEYCMASAKRLYEVAKGLRGMPKEGDRLYTADAEDVENGEKEGSSQVGTESPEEQEKREKEQDVKDAPDTKPDEKAPAEKAEVIAKEDSSHVNGLPIQPQPRS